MEFGKISSTITVAEIWQSYFFQKIAFLFEIAILFCKITFFLWNPDFFIVNLIFSFSRSRIPSFTTRSSFTYNLVFLFHAGNEFNVVWIRPVATRRLRSDHGLIAMVTSWPRLFIAVAWHAMSLVCDVRVCLRCSLWEHFVWACLRSPHRYAWLREWPFVVAWLRENEKNYYVLA